MILNCNSFTLYMLNQNMINDLLQLAQVTWIIRVTIAGSHGCNKDQLIWVCISKFSRLVDETELSIELKVIMQPHKSHVYNHTHDTSNIVITNVGMSDLPDM